MTQSLSVDQLQEALYTWYDEQKRELPWRNTTDPYKILVSEVMLQQTQVSRVVPKYKEFLEKFPTVQDLAEASLKDVLPVWDGLGFNRRAKFLHRSAQIIVEDYGGEVPQDAAALQELPGVGEYTAQAVLAFAFNTGAKPVFDTNVRRLFYRFHGPENDTRLRAAHQDVFDEDHPRKWNNAVMELGSQICTTGTPQCKACPWREDCTAWRKKDFSEPETGTQSRFQDSWRFYRAKTLKLLMAAALPREELVDALELPAEYDADALLTELVDEGLVEEVDGVYRLPS